MIKTDNNIEVFDNIELLYQEYYNNNYIDLNDKKITTSALCAGFGYVQECLNINLFNTDINILNAVFKQYKKIVIKYNIKSLLGFYLLFDIDNSIFKSIINNSIIDSNALNNNIDCINNSNSIVVDSGVRASNAIIELCKKSQQLYQDIIVNTLNDDKTGIIVNANNNKTIGLNYAAQQIETAITTKKLVNLASLPKLD